MHSIHWIWIAAEKNVCPLCTQTPRWTDHVSSSDQKNVWQSQQVTLLGKVVKAWIYTDVSYLMCAISVIVITTTGDEVRLFMLAAYDLGMCNGDYVFITVDLYRTDLLGAYDWRRGKFRADSRLAPSQWETSLRSNAVSHWLGANLESAL